MVVEYARVRCFQCFAVRCMKNNPLSKSKSRADLNVCSETTRQQNY